VARLHDKVALISGASGSIGRAIALAFAREGAALVLTGKSSSTRSAQLLTEIQDLGAPAQYLAGDLRDEATARHVVDAAVHAHGRLDVLVNNAGVDFHSLIADTDATDFDRVVAINVRGMLLLTKHALPYLMRGSGAAIVNVASRLALVGLPGQAVYCGTKGAVVSMTRALALDHAGQNVRVNCICPGPIDTPMIRDWLQEQENPAEFERGVLAGIPLRRLGQPDEIAMGVVFLASDEASYITGAALPIDGGYTAA
jgi:NAD(P)-dependent dehydrogenase (short-subunit alcohol dehydrogenase family)